MKFYDGKQLLDKNCIYNFIVGGRASGKSYWLAKHLLKDYLEHGHKFVRVVRNLSFVTGLESYFRIVESDMKEEGELPDDYEGVTMKGLEYRIGNAVIGKVLSCSQEQKYKSLVFESDYVNLIFEEFAANDVSEYWISPKFEIACFQSIISTVFRHRTGRVFFIGNNYEVNNPYFEHYGVNSAKLELGKITTFQNSFEVNGKKINGASVAVEYVPMAYENIEEIPVMLRTAENEMATTGEITKSPHILENCINFLRDAAGISAILVTGIKLNCPKIFRTFWIRGNQYMSDEIYENDNYREYIIVIDRAGVCLVSEIPDVEEAIDLRSYGASVMRQIERTEGCYPMQQEMMDIPLDIETVTGTKINMLYFNNQATEYNFKQDCDDLKEMRALNKRLGMGETPLTETVKDYVETCKRNNLNGYGTERRDIYSDITYQNYAANGLLEAKGFDVEGYIRKSLENIEAEESYSLESTKESIAQIELHNELKEKLKKKHGGKLLAKKRKELEEQFVSNPDDIVEKVQDKISDITMENILYCYPDFHDGRISKMAESIERKVNNIIRNKVTVNNVKDYWEILVDVDYIPDISELDDYLESALGKLWKEKQHYEKYHSAKITNVNEVLPKPLPCNYSTNPDDYARKAFISKPIPMHQYSLLMDEDM